MLAKALKVFLVASVRDASHELSAKLDERGLTPGPGNLAVNAFVIIGSFKFVLERVQHLIVRIGECHSHQHPHHRLIADRLSVNRVRERCPAT